MNEEQRQGLEELATWRASLRSGTVNGDDAEPGTVAAAGPATPVAVVDRETSNGEVTETEPRADPDVIDDTDTDDTDIENTYTDDKDTAGDRTEFADEAATSEREVDETEDDEYEEDEAPRRRPLVDWLVVMGIALLAAFLIRTYVLAHFVVDGTSMVTTLEDTDRVFVNKLSYRLHDPRRGDVVVLHEIDATAQRDLIKRVVGLPGETIEMRNCQVFVGGRLLIEPYLDPEVVRPGNCGEDFQPLAVEDGHVFVMGDNRGGSMDSRVLGTVDEDDLVGRAFVVFWPSSNWRWL
ncbi:MAG: signal peptidase I [Actinomycetota bacterium]|nr:signal peptidase I [Actinomycetota bacterium]